MSLGPFWQLTELLLDDGDEVVSSVRCHGAFSATRPSINDCYHEGVLAAINAVNGASASCVSIEIIFGRPRTGVRLEAFVAQDANSRGSPAMLGVEWSTAELFPRVLASSLEGFEHPRSEAMFLNAGDDRLPL